MAGPTEPPDPIYRELRELRRTAGVSQQTLAERLGLHRTYLSHWEAGRWRPRLPRLRAWAAALGYDLILVRVNWHDNDGANPSGRTLTPTPTCQLCGGWGQITMPDPVDPAVRDVTIACPDCAIAWDPEPLDRTERTP